MDAKDMISLRIKQLRKENGYTQKQLSELTGISLKSIINYENKVREPNSKSMASLEKLFNVSGAYLRGETDIKERMIWDDPEIMNEMQTELISSMKSLSELCLKQSEKNQKMLFDFFVEFRCLIKATDKDDDLSNVTDLLIKNVNTMEKIIKNK